MEVRYCHWQGSKLCGARNATRPAESRGDLWGAEGLAGASRASGGVEGLAGGLRGVFGGLAGGSGRH